MGMYKIELHTTESGFDSLGHLEDSGLEIIGGLSLHHYRNFATASPPEEIEQVKVELFTSSSPEEVLEKLSGLGRTTNIHIQPCSLLRIEQSMTQAPKPGPALAAEPARHCSDVLPADPDKSVSCAFSSTASATTHLKIEAAATPHFLSNVFAVLEYFEIVMLSGRKFRQGQKDFAVFSLAQTPEVLFRDIENHLSEVFKTANYTKHSFGPAVGEIRSEDLAITLNTKDSMPALQVAGGNTPAFRWWLCNYLRLLNVDVPLARFATRNNRIEDVFHLKSLSSRMVPADLPGVVIRALTSPMQTFSEHNTHV